MSAPASPGARPGTNHIAALDGVRGLAILLVLFVHFLGDDTPQGPIERLVIKLANFGSWGVDLFFVLSGFLITGILYDSKKTEHYLRNFYVRRTLRIFPLYYGVLALLFVALPALPVAYPAGLAESASHQAWLWTYMSNIYVALKGAWALPFVSHFWSLAVEEHFYLFWPFVVLFFGRKALLRICAGAIAFAMVLRCGLHLAGASEVTLVAFTPCRLDALCTGALLAVAARGTSIAHLAHSARRALPVLAALVVAVTGWHTLGGPMSDLLLATRGTLVALAFGAMLILVVDAPAERWYGRLFRSGTMGFFGRYSYGIYVFHGLIAFAMQANGAEETLTHLTGSHPLAMLLFAVTGVSASVLAAVASYELYEKQFLRFKDRFAPGAPAKARRPAPAAAPATVTS